MGQPCLAGGQPTPSMAGDIDHFLNYKHFMLDLRYSLVNRNPHMIGVKMLFFLMTEMLAFARMLASIVLVRNTLFLLMVVFAILQGNGFFSSMTDLHLLTILAVVDAIKAAYVVFLPEVLIPDTMVAHLVVHGPFLVQMVLVNWFT